MGTDVQRCTLFAIGLSALQWTHPRTTVRSESSCCGAAMSINAFSFAVPAETAGWISQQGLQAKWVEMLAEAMLDSGSVLLPGGHGASISNVRSRHADFPVVVHPAQRCFVCLATLGDPECLANSKWNRRAWLDHVSAWFDRVAPALGSTIDRAGKSPRWHYLIWAMVRVAEQSPEYIRREWLLETRCFAVNTVRALKSRGLSSTPTERSEPLPGREALLSGAQSSGDWVQAARTLDSEDAALLQAAYFMHVLHTQRGVPQPDWDTPYSTRRAAYSEVLRLLQRPDLLPSKLVPVAARTAAALATTALMSEPGSQPIRMNKTAPHTLPTCFQPAHLGCRAPEWSSVAAQLAQAHASEATRNELALVHDLGEAVADLLADPLLPSRHERIGCGPTRLDRLSWSLVRDGQRKLDRLQRLGRSAIRDDLYDSSPAKTPAARISTLRCFAESDFLSKCHALLQEVRLPAAHGPSERRAVQSSVQRY